MGVLTDIVVADSSEAIAVAQSSVPSRDWEGIDAKGIEHVKLAQLSAILRDESYDPDFVTQIEDLAEVSEEGPWVFRLPQDFVHRLASLSEDQTPVVAEKWAKTEEFILDGWAASDVASVLSDLHRVAEIACSRDKALLMWMSL